MKYRTPGRTGIRMSHLAVALAITHPGVTSKTIGPRTTDDLQDLLEGIDATLDGAIHDRIDAGAAPAGGTGPLDMAYGPPALTETARCRHPVTACDAA
ncbi:hypothetical protein ABZ434_24225 [Streptomyces sp. NPDC005761]|uniref:hypothetical protein n=1 Tax=unclassified Streptomyces TaxID=2593676 RepID=UPI0033C6B1FB